MSKATCLSAGDDSCDFARLSDTVSELVAEPSTIAESELTECA